MQITVFKLLALSKIFRAQALPILLKVISALEKIKKKIVYLEGPLFVSYTI